MRLSMTRLLALRLTMSGLPAPRRHALGLYAEEYDAARIQAVEEVVTRSVTHEENEIIQDVKMMFDDTKAQELVVENLPEPPSDPSHGGNTMKRLWKDEEIQEKLSRLKKFNKKWLDDESINLDNKFEDAVKVPQENEHDEPSELDDDICVKESDEEYAAEVQEFNNWYNRKLEERLFSKGKTENDVKS